MSGLRDTPWALASLRELLELFCGAADHVRLRAERLREPRDLRVRFLPALLLDRLAHARQRLHAVARVEPWSVYKVPVPGPARQSVRAGERALGLEQRSVEG